MEGAKGEPEQQRGGRGGHPPPRHPRVGRCSPWGCRQAGSEVACGSGDLSGAPGKRGRGEASRGPSRGPEQVGCGVHRARPRLEAGGGSRGSYGEPRLDRRAVWTARRIWRSVSGVGLGPSRPVMPPPQGEPPALTLCAPPHPRASGQGPSPSPQPGPGRAVTLHQVSVVLCPAGRPAAVVLSQRALPEVSVVINAYLITALPSPLQKLRNGLRPSAGNGKLIKVGFCATLAL